MAEGLKVAIVGSGPSGFYTAKYLLRDSAAGSEGSVPVGEVNIIDRLPTPYGLVRYGVAPDHPEVKNVIDDYETVAQDPRFNYFGNVTLGAGPADDSGTETETVSLAELQATHDAVVLAYGADSDRSLGVEGENLRGVLSARTFVNWYNGHPEFKYLTDEILGPLLPPPPSSSRASASALLPV